LRENTRWIEYIFKNLPRISEHVISPEEIKKNANEMALKKGEKSEEGEKSKDEEKTKSTEKTEEVVKTKESAKKEKK